ncbi:acyltransferase [Tardiphaga sp.]|uniref:acyltransferase family protein n=1 Tax=Tardiphaga sp. TaxID=1926292 RepID=UPI00260E9775|nr:acyltransferase [Tardiphaga sp.]MDB5617354.1 hypothetical protein [Tardiphaga sp.]
MAETIIPQRTQTIPSTPPNKLLGLELVRFIAAVAVLVWHYQHFSYIAGTPVDLVTDQLPLYGLLRPFYEAGKYGVWVFWCVSGFIFFWRYRDVVFERAMPGWTFFVFRLSRLYPLHVVTLILVALLQAIYFRQHGYFFIYQNNDIQHFLLQFFMASKWGLESGDSFNGPIWSISVEVLVYVTFFVLLRFVTRSALMNIVVILACLNMEGQFFLCLSFFYAGGLAAIARRSLASAKFPRAIESAGWIAAAAVPVLIWLFSPSPQSIDWLFCMACTPLVLFCLSCKITLAAPVQRWLEAAGNMTYSSYLLHFPLQLLIASGCAMFGSKIPLYETWFFVAFMAATLALSYLTYRYFEAPAQMLLRRSLLRGAVAPSRPMAMRPPPSPVR